MFGLVIGLVLREVVHLIKSHDIPNYQDCQSVFVAVYPWKR